MPLNVLRNGTYDRKAWKNGGGITEDVWLSPKAPRMTTSRSGCRWRETAGPFSAFAGIDRTITLVGGDPFVLEFDGTGNEDQPAAFQF